jgi:hypothetical protein
VDSRETVLLVRYVRACCPQQRMDEFTPDAWHDLLGDLTLDDCKRAVQEIASRQPFVAPSEIRAEVRRIRDERLNRDPVPAPPAELLDDPAAYAEYLQQATRQAASGGEDERRAIGGAR